MSTTSVAVVYAVMIESGLGKRPLGQLIFAVCFFTGLGTVVALSLLFANANLWLAALVAAIAASTLLVPKFLPAILARTGRYVSEPGLRLLFALVFALSAPAAYAKSESILPAYFLGLACANALIAQPGVKRQLQTIAMTLLTPFYFLKGGASVSLRDAWGDIALIGAFFCIKVLAKVVGVLPRSGAVLQPYGVSRRWLVVKRRIARKGDQESSLSTPAWPSTYCLSTESGAPPQLTTQYDRLQKTGLR